MAISLPAILFLVDWLLVGNPFRIPELVRRYAVIALIAVFYLALQYSIRTTHVYSAVFGYTLGPQIASMLVQYLSLSVFPWGYYPPTDTQIVEGFPLPIPAISSGLAGQSRSTSL